MRVSTNAEMQQFMHDHIVYERRLRHDNAPVESEGTIRTAAPPALALISREDSRSLAAEHRDPAVDTILQTHLSTSSIPTLDRICNAVPRAGACQARRHVNME